jgi:hypothetical protein
MITLTESTQFVELKVVIEVNCMMASYIYDENRVLLRYQECLNATTFDISNPKEITDPVQRNQLSNPNERLLRSYF